MEGQNKNSNPNNLKTFTQWTKKSNESIFEGEEDLVEINDAKYNPVFNEIDTVIRPSARQNNWVRKLFVLNSEIDDLEYEIKSLEYSVSNPTRMSFNTGSNGENKKGQLDFLRSESNVKENLSLKKNERIEKVKQRTAIDKEIEDYEETLASTDQNYKKGSLKVGVDSAYEFAELFTKKEKKGVKLFDGDIKMGDRLYTNDTIDAVDKIDFVQTDISEDGYLGEINLIQVKSSKPPQNKEELKEMRKIKPVNSDETIESINKAHQGYIEKMNKVAQNEITKDFKLKTIEEIEKAADKFHFHVYDLIDNLSKIDKDKKNNSKENIIDSIIGKSEEDLTNDDWIEFAFIMDNIDDFDKEIFEICNKKFDSLDLKIFKNWLNDKTKMKFDKKNKEATYKEYRPNNIVTGRKFNSVIYYKGDSGWEKIVETLTN